MAEDFERQVLSACDDEWQRLASGPDEFAWVTIEAISSRVDGDEATPSGHARAIRAAMAALMNGRSEVPRLEVIGVRRRGSAQVAEVAWRLRPNGRHAEGG